ncbi:MULTISPECIES: glycosyltransferase family 4 protein [unclassified Rhizobium]|uniref:glycosyltransferase family 4 protein n=1 Tax=unclassified Rhizobium TaxID=2613769 RepID=UPI003822F9F6
MHIVLISHSPHLQGAEKMLVNLACAIAKIPNWSVSVLIPEPHLGVLPKILDVNRIAWYPIPSHNWFIELKREDAAALFQSARRNAGEIARILSVIKADVIIVNTMTALDGAIAAIRINKPFLVWCHGILESWWLGIDSSIRRQCENILIAAADKVVCISDTTRLYYQHFSGGGNFETIYNWTNVPNKRPLNDKNIVFSYLGTAERHKGLPTLLAAFHKVVLGGEPGILDLYIEQSDYVSNFIHINDLSGRVNVCGRSENVDKVYRNSYCVVIPSLIEPFGMVAVEAMAWSTPVVASSVGGLTEIIEDERSGLLFPAGDSDKLAEKISYLIRNPAEAARLGEGGYKRVRSKFSGKISLRRFTALLSTSVEEHKVAKRNNKILENVVEIFGLEFASPQGQFAIDSTIQKVVEVPSASTEASIPEQDNDRSNFEELLSGRYLKGWAHQGVAGPSELEIYIDGHIVGSCIAEIFRPDLQAAGIAEGKRGFVFPIPERFLDGRGHQFDIRFARGGRSLANSPSHYVTESGTDTLLREKSRFGYSIISQTARSLFDHLRYWPSQIDRLSRGAKPFVVGVGDGPNPSTELLLHRPLHALREYGYSSEVFLEDCLPPTDVLRGVDVVLLARATRDTTLHFAQEAKKEGARVIYMIDDDLFALAEDRGLDPSFADRINSLLNLSDRVVAFSPELVATLRPKVASIQELPVYSNIEYFDMLEKTTRPLGAPFEVRIGYAGTSTHAGDIALIEDVLLSIISARPNVVVESIGQFFPRLADETRYRYWKEVQGIREFENLLYSRNWTIGLAPLEQTRFNAGKTDNKFRQYGAAKVAGIYSNIAPYRDSVSHGRTGLLTENSREEWRKAIEYLVDSPQVRETIALNAARNVRARYGVNYVTQSYHKLLQSIF